MNKKSSMTLIDELDRMLHEHMRGIEQQEKRERIPHSTPPYTFTHGKPLPPHTPHKPTRKASRVKQSNKPVHLTDPEIIRSYNANRILGENERAYVEHRSMTWRELAERRYERHERY